MSSVFGYIGKNIPLQTIFDGLKRLEYLEYDSAGIAFQNGKGIEVYKTRGKLQDLQKIVPDTNLNVNIGIGHTRWATHGIPSSINAHPHFINGIAVVHNGIIINHRKLRSELLREGNTFISETDTEVIPQLISKYRGEGMSIVDAIRMTASRLIGNYAAFIISDDTPDTLYAVRNGKPLAIGIVNGDYYFASEVTALLPYTNRFIFIEDEQICILRKEDITVQGMHSDSSSSVSEITTEVDWTPTLAEKRGYDHFMLKEIHEQPQSLKDTLCEWIEDPVNLLTELGLNTKSILDIKSIQIAACGTSYHAALVGKYVIENLVRIKVDVDIASEYRYKDPIVEKGTLFVSITQSGETIDTLEAQREAKRKGARTLTICNVLGSTSTREADSVLYTRAGPEIGVAATKSFSVQMATLFLLAVALGSKRGRLSYGEGETFKHIISKIPVLMEKALNKDTEIRKLASNLVNTNGFLFIGRGINYPIAREGALKLKEISYINTAAYHGGEIKHGPIALIENGLPVIVLVPVDDLYDVTLSNIDEVKSRGGRVIAITDDGDRLANKVDDVIEVPSTHPSLSPFLTVIPLQLLAYHLGVLRGCDVDRPRSRLKNVTT
jgi:glucosamine--fructose-6-phosphate aminotransferase (isomerizing)